MVITAIKKRYAWEIFEFTGPVAVPRATAKNPWFTASEMPRLAMIGSVNANDICARLLEPLAQLQLGR